MPESETTPTLDPILVEVLRHKYQSITEEMGYTLQRASHTVFVNETADFSTGLATVNGELFAYPQSLGVSVMVNANLKVAIDTVGAFDEGDIIITNDPYTSGSLASHLPDTNVFKPIYIDGELVAFAWAYVHSTDVGGSVPGSLSPASSDIFQEGTRIPPSKLYQGGELNHTVLAIIRANCRAPDDNWGDIKAVISALNVGEERVVSLCRQFGRDTFVTSSEQLLAYADLRARQIFASIPDGTYEFTDFLDNDVVTDNPVRLRVRLELHSGEVTLDLRNCDVQSRSSFNIASHGLPHPWLVYRLITFLYTMDPHIPINGGLLRSVKVRTQPGSIVDCTFPAAMGLRTTTSIRLMDALHGALTKVVPGRLPAASGGTMVPVVVAELDLERGGRRVRTVEPLAGGTGAGEGYDGVDARDVGLANLRNTPIEIVDSESTVVIRKYSLSTDSGGAGKYRGGAGVVLELAARQADTIITARGMERQRFRAWGLAGGRAGGLANAILNPGTDREQVVPKLDGIVLNSGDVLRLCTPGAGGFGDPFERPADKVLIDVQRGAVSVNGARTDYGVVVVNGKVDKEATDALRSSPRQSAKNYDFGSEREIYENRWPEKVQQHLMELLYQLPTALRSFTKEHLVARVESKTAGEIDISQLDQVWDEMDSTSKGMQ